MTGVLLALAVLFLSGFAVSAQTLVFRSGEHGDYTRLVVALPQDAQWRVEARDSGLRLDFSTPFSAVDTTNVFRRIDRRRVSAINVLPDNRGIDVSLACDCGFRAFLEGDALLVIDVGEGFPAQTSAEAGTTNRGLAAGEDLQRDVALPLFGNSTSTPLFLPLSPRDPARDASMFDRTPEPQEVLLPARPARPAPGSDLGRLPAEIANAAAQGLLIPRDPMDPAFDVGPGGSAVLRHPNVNTLVATEMPGLEEPASTTADGQVCSDAGVYDLPRWGHEAGFSTGLSEWRTSLTQEFDRVDVRAAIGLARHYLHYGFGKEALASLSLLPQPDPQVDHLRRMARIVDLEHDPHDDDSSWMMACDGPVALWSVLSSDDLPLPHQLDVAAVRLAFEDLPQALKQHLGPRLATRFAASGDTVTAEGILSSVERGSSAPNPALQFAQANLRGDEAQDADGQLADIVGADTELAPLALVALVDSAVSAGQPIEENQVDLIAAYVFENRGTELSRELDRAHVLALAFSGQFVEALDRLELLEAETHDPLTRSQVMTRLLEQADDVSFLTAVLGRPRGDISAALENRIAERFLNMGFAEAALEVIVAPAEGSDGRARRIIRAEAALQLNEPIVAEAELLGLSGEDVVSLRTEARRRQGDFAAAPTGGPEDMSEQEKRDLDWLSGKASLFETAIDAGNQPPSRQTSAPDETPTGMLGQAESLIDDSSETRLALQDLLSRFPVQADQSP